MTKLKESNCDNTKNLDCDKIQIMTKLQNSNCNKLGQNSKTQIRPIFLKFKLQHISTTKNNIMTKLKNSNGDKTKKPKL